MGGDILFHQTSHFSPRRRRATLSLLEISDRVISMSDYLIAPYHKLHSRSLITPWGIDFEQFAATTDTAVSQRRELRAALGIAARTPVVLSPRRLVPVCNVASIVEAMALVREGVEDAVLVLLDDAPNASYRQRVADCIERLGGAVEVRWLTRADYTSMPDMYAIADVTVSVAQSDGVSLAVLESMAAGVPVVLGRLPNYAGVFDDGLHCRTVDPDDPRAIAAGIIEVLTDTSLRAVLIREAQSKARRDGNLVREAARVETMLRDMVRERHRPRRIVRRIAHALNLALLVFESHTRR